MWDELAGITGLWEDKWFIEDDFNVCRFESETQLHKEIKSNGNILRYNSRPCIIDLPLQEPSLLGLEEIIINKHPKLTGSSFHPNGVSFKAVRQIAMPKFSLRP